MNNSKLNADFPDIVISQEENEDNETKDNKEKIRINITVYNKHKIR